MRPTCTECAKKHLSQSSILLQESRQGYPKHYYYSMGHLAEAEAELIKLYPDKAEMVREERKKLEADRNYTPDYDHMLETVDRECKTCQLQQENIHEYANLIKNKTGNNHKTLYLRKPQYNSSERDMKGTKEIALVFGGNWIGKAIQIGEQSLDAMYPGAIMGQDPSLLVNAIGTGLGIVAAVKGKGIVGQLGLLVGAYLSTGLYENAQRIMVPSARFAVSASIPRNVITTAPIRTTQPLKFS